MENIDIIDKDPTTNVDWKNLLNFTNVIRNKDIKDFTKEFLLTEVPDYFARIAASATGKYHPEYASGYGGLVRHTLAVATIAYSFIGLKYLQLQSNDRDYIVAACILHDTFKQGVNESGYTIRTHPEVAAKQILEFGKKTGREEVSKIIAGLVVAHMGEFGNHKPGNRGQFIVHLADFLASRRFIDVSWDSVLEEVNKSK